MEGKCQLNSKTEMTWNDRHRTTRQQSAVNLGSSHGSGGIGVETACSHRGGDRQHCDRSSSRCSWVGGAKKREISSNTEPVSTYRALEVKP